MKNTGGLPETVTHQKSGIIHPLFSLFLSPHGILIPLQPHSPLTQRVLPEIFTLFSWFKSIWLCELLGRNRLLPSIFHSLPCFMSFHFRVPGSTGFILLQQLKNGVFFPPILNINSHLVSVFFAREASGLSRTQCLRKGSPGAACIRASLWLWASWPQSPRRGRRKGAVGVISNQEHGVGYREASRAGDRRGSTEDPLWKILLGSPVFWLVWCPRFESDF